MRLHTVTSFALHYTGKQHQKNNEPQIISKMWVLELENGVFTRGKLITYGLGPSEMKMGRVPSQLPISLPSMRSKEKVAVEGKVS